jgi:ubiquitin C-terminal hydrolase
MKPLLKTPVSSFSSAQEAPTPTISNCAPPKMSPPPLALELPFSRVSSLPVRSNSNSNSTSRNSSLRYSTSQHRSPPPPRMPKFSSQTVSPIVMQRPLVDPPFFVGDISSRSSSKDKTKNKKAARASLTFHYPLEPTLALSTAFRELSLLNNPANHTTTNDWRMTMMMFQLIPWLLACDLLKTDAPWKLLRRTLTSLLQRLLTRRPTLITSPHQQLLTTLLPPTQTQRSSPVTTQVQTIRGIPNYGQTCFLNSVLQALASLEPFLAYLERILQIQEELPTRSSTSHDDDNGKDEAVPRHILELLQAVNGSRDVRRIDPRPLLKKIAAKHAQFQSREQQDAQELLQALLGVVIDEAPLDNLSSRFLEDSYYDDSDTDETLTAVIAGDETKYAVDWSPTTSSSSTSFDTSNNNMQAGNGDSILSLSCLLQRMDEEQQKQPQSSQRILLRTKENGNDSSKPQDDADRMHQREEKKQEDFEITVPFTASEEDLVHLGHQQQHHSAAEMIHQRMDDSTISDNFSASATGTNHHQSPQPPKLSTAMQIMKSTISSITPSPLSGWLGSTLRCCNCKHVRPIQNAPFLDIPVVPTSVPTYLANSHSAKVRSPAPNISPMPACSLGQCLVDFTSVERVQDVECRVCTLQTEMERLQDEATLLRGAIGSMEKRKRSPQKKRGDPSSDETKYLKQDLTKVELRLVKLQTMDPDEEEFSLVEKSSENDDLLLGEQPPPAKPLERCDARKCLLLTRCPSILCCHVQRRYFDPFTNRMEKCVQFVEFPQTLDLSPYCAYGPRARTPWAAGSLKPHCQMPSEEQQQGKMLYRLQSIIEHRGNAHGGHYVSYRRNASGDWFRISDNNVTPISWRQVRTCQAYMLFYEAM